MREIVFDTETTGLYADKGDRVIEIGCVEMVNRVCTGNNYHVYLNVDVDINPEAQKVHGITKEFLKDKPKFEDVAEEFLEYIGESDLIAHNAQFDVGFINAELKKWNRGKRLKNKIIDTLVIARKKFPGAKNNLDALCRRFKVDNTGRELHGALLDSELLADVYVELLGGRQIGINLANQVAGSNDNARQVQQEVVAGEFKNYQLTEEEIKAHKEFVEKIENSIWERYYKEG